MSELIQSQLYDVDSDDEKKKPKKTKNSGLPIKSL